MIFKKDNEHLDWPKYINNNHYMEDERISIHESAYVAAGTDLGVDVYIGPGVTVFPRCSIGSSSVLKPNVTLGAGVTILPEVFLNAGCLVDPNVTISARIRIGHHIHVLSTPVCITGSRHLCCWFEPGVLAIGCEQHSIEYWLCHYSELGNYYTYSDEEIAEYLKYIKFFAANPCKSLGRVIG